MGRRNLKLLSVILSILVMATCITFMRSGNNTVITITLTVYIPIQIYLNYCMRCKHCGRWPRRGNIFTEYCPYCGESLE